ncbi:hypothetical protein DVH24_004195 [Malus domestica]|uniref:Aminotransferase-like plant mobile domain-containing protein n=1 Tax=Malus domestica TaxID=3750 RepID=A0A498KDL9_MALDO|nr:hypothetical protein DVH24_004195 [Malus domestica]
MFFNDGGITHRSVFSITIHLSSGTRIALAPAVLSSVYNDLGVLKKATVDSNQWEVSSAAEWETLEGSKALRAMEKSEESMVEERKDMMISPSGGKPFLKKSYFLKPTLLNSSIDEPLFNLPPSFSSLPSRFEPDTCALKVDFQGWPQQNKSNWKSWVHEMAVVHRSTWKKAGIYEVIFSSTYQIKRQTGLYSHGGEATITLEDIMVLGGFSVLGDSILSPLDTAELNEIEDKLLAQRKDIIKSRAKKATTSSWLNRFINGRHELKHEAFLVYWLSRYVFNDGGIIHRPVFSIAIHLARGTRIALEPVILSSVYNDLGVLKKVTVDLNQLESSCVAVSDLAIRSLFQFGHGNDPRTLGLKTPIISIMVSQEWQDGIK